MEDQVLQAKCLRNVVVEERGADGAVLARTELSPQLALKKEMGNARLVSDDAMLWVAHGALETQRESDDADAQRVTLTSGKRSFSFFLACDAPADAFLAELRAQVAGERGREHARKRRKIRRQLADSQRAGFVPVVHSLASPAKPPTQASPSTPCRRRLSDVSNSPRRLAPPLPFTMANSSAASTVSEAHGVFPSPSKSPFRSPFRKPGASPASSTSSTPAPRRASPIVSLSSLPPKSPAVHATPPSGTSSAASSASPQPPREWLSPARGRGSGAGPGRVRVQLTPPSIRRDPSLTPASSSARSSASEKENTPVRAASGGIVNKRVRSLQRMLDDVPREEPEHTAGARPPPVRSPYLFSPTNAREMSPVRRPSPAKKLRNSPSRVLGELHQNSTPPLRPLSATRTPGSNPQSGATSLLAGAAGLRKVTHGLLNLGNFCYMNAIVQSLAALPGFADRLQSDDWIVPIIKKLLAAKGTERSAQEITELLAKWKQADAGDRLAVQDKLALLLQQVIDGSDSSINPEPLKAVMGRRNPRFASHFQQDAHEFLLQLVTEYEKELVQAVDGVLKSPAPDVSNEPASTQESEPAAEEPPTEQPPAPKKTSLLNFFRLGKKADDADANPSAAPSEEPATAAVAAPSSALDTKEQEELVTELFPAACFRTELYRTLTCCSCKYSRRQVEKFYDFSLDLPFVPLPKSPAFEPQPEPSKPDLLTKQCHCGVDAAVIESAGERFYSCAKSACSLRDKVEEAAEPAEPEPSPIKATTEAMTVAALQPTVSERSSFNAIQLSDLLKDQFKSEVLELTCEKCKDGREATARYEVKSLPRVLVLHLKRFEVNPETGTLYKRCDLVEAPRELFPVQDIHGCDARAPELGDLADKRYTIKSVVHHLGKTVDEGHYVADVCGPRGVWRRRNDTHETLIGEDFALRASRSQESCYMMFYVLATPADELEKDKENLTATTPTAPTPTRSPVVTSATTPDSPASLVGRRREMTPPRRDASKVSKSLHDLL